MQQFVLSNQAIDRNVLIDQFQDPHCGAFLSFEGWVRNHHDNKAVSHLFYEAYPQLALHEGDNIIDQAIEKFSIESALCVHRIGELQIGDMAVWVGVNAAHRDAAFLACRYIIDEIKKDVPIWKKEFYTDQNPTAWLHPLQA